MAIGDEIVRLPVSQDPRRSADAALGLLLKHLAADGAACFRIHEERLVLFAGRSVDQVALDRVASTWDDAREALLGGRAYDAEPSFAVIPIGGDDAVAGLLYVGADHGLVLDDAALGHLVPLLRAAPCAVEQSTEPALETYIARTPAAQFQREQLVLLLERHEWNIARVARAKGVTRLTIYEQMRRWRIERRKVVKGRGTRIQLTS
jgi:transcriptional regulator with GAF, ATPase, and Fis domain